MKFDCEFLFATLAEKHNAVISKIREIQPWEWGGEFLELEPQVLRFLGIFCNRYPECAAFKTAHTLASALAVYRLASRKPKTLTEQERAICIAANRDLVDEYSDALLRAYREIFNFLFEQGGNAAHTDVAEIIKAIRAEHTQTRRQIIKPINTRNTDGLDITGPRSPECRDQPTCNRTPEPTNRRIKQHKSAALKPSPPLLLHHYCLTPKPSPMPTSPCETTIPARLQGRQRPRTATAEVRR